MALCEATSRVQESVIHDASAAEGGCFAVVRGAILQLLHSSLVNCSATLGGAVFAGNSISSHRSLPALVSFLI